MDKDIERFLKSLKLEIAKRNELRTGLINYLKTENEFFDNLIKEIDRISDPHFQETIDELLEENKQLRERIEYIEKENQI